MKKQLQSVLEQLDDTDNNQEALGYQALAIIKDILDVDPYDIETRNLRMRLNANVFENSSEIITDATFIIEHDVFKKDKMIGYEWLAWVYESNMGMPEKAMEVVEEQLVEMHTLFDKRHEKDEREGGLLNQLAQLKYDHNQLDEAFKLWDLSFDKYPYLSQRNGFVGLQLLAHKEWSKATKFLLLHYNWCFVTEDGYRLKYGIKLKELYEQKALEEQPELLGLLFNIIRNEQDYFKLNGQLDFYEKYFADVEEYANKHPQSTLLWTAVAHTYHFDTKNYEKAFFAYKKLALTKDSFRFSSLKRAMKAARKSKNDFFEIAPNLDVSANELYNNLTDLSNATDSAKKKKKKKKFAELAVLYGKAGYDRFRAYLLDGNGQTIDNQPHIFAMHCNNYANAMGEYADLYYKDDEEKRALVYKEAGDIHIEGHNMSPFMENMENASRDYYKGKDYKNSIKYALETFKLYGDGLSVCDYLFHYWQMVRSGIALDDLDTVEKYYFEAKKLYNKVGAGSKDTNDKFIYISKLFYEFAVDKKQEYSKFIPEMEWFLREEIATKQEPLEHGLISYYLGICYQKTNQKEKALNAFQIAVDFLQDADWTFYDLKCEKAEEFMQELGGKANKKSKPKSKKSAFKRIKGAILFPFFAIALIGGIIWAAMKSAPSDSDGSEGKKK